jgi:hypothetical protein
MKSSYVWDSSTPVLKFTQLNLPFSTGVSGAALCFSFRAGSACTRFSDLCPNGCSVATFNQPEGKTLPVNQCCPRFGLSI